MRFPSALPVVLRTLLLLMLVVGTAVRPTLVMICELQGALSGEGRQAQLDAPATAADPAQDEAPADQHPNGHAHGSHGVLQNLAPDGFAAILPAWELPVVYQQAVPMPDMTASPPPPQPSSPPFRPPIG